MSPQHSGGRRKTTTRLGKVLESREISQKIKSCQSFKIAVLWSPHGLTIGRYQLCLLSCPSLMTLQTGNIFICNPQVGDLGVGAAGVVTLGIHKETGEKVAIKDID